MKKEIVIEYEGILNRFCNKCKNNKDRKSCDICIKQFAEGLLFSKDIEYIKPIGYIVYNCVKEESNES